MTKQVIAIVSGKIAISHLNGALNTEGENDLLIIDNLKSTNDIVEKLEEARLTNTGTDSSLIVDVGSVATAFTALGIHLDKCPKNPKPFSIPTLLLENSPTCLANERAKLLVNQCANISFSMPFSEWTKENRLTELVSAYKEGQGIPINQKTRQRVPTAA